MRRREEEEDGVVVDAVDGSSEVKKTKRDWIETSEARKTEGEV